MKIKIDENLPIEIAERLRKEGYDTATVGEQKLGGQRDEIIAAVCQTEERVLITLDTDFADIRTYPPEQHNGILVLRCQKQDKVYVQKFFEKVIPLLRQEEINGKLWIVDEQRVKIRE